MKTILSMVAFVTILSSCTKEPVQRQVQFHATCFECTVQWSTSMGNSGSFGLVGDTSFTTMVDEYGYFRIQACAPGPFSIAPPWDTLAYVHAGIDGVRAGSHYTDWIDSCAVVNANVPSK